MQLLSLAFLVFLLAVLATYLVFGRLCPRHQWVVLLVASLCFYCMVGSWQTLGLMVTVALATWAAPLVMARMDRACRRQRKEQSDKAERRRIKRLFARRKRMVLIGVAAACFAIMAYLKYWNVLLAEMGLAASPNSLGLVLPLGISFYTFQSVGYLIDAYNGRFEPQRNFAKHLLFVSYFPQVIQGPINRYGSLAPQLLEPHPFDAMRARRASLLFMYGAIKKLAVANVAGVIVDGIFSHVGAGMPGSVVVFGILLYSAQQYGDFSGGIDMVAAASELLGIEMDPNFRRPYFSVSLGDFWRRWHISLGAWMRDYVFYPLAVSSPLKRFGKWSQARLGTHAGRTLPACVANIIVFFIVGLWHGAEAHYLAWGLYNGIVIALADLLTPVWGRLNDTLKTQRHPRAMHLWRVLRTFLVVNLGWYFDRIYTLPDLLACLRATVLDFRPDALMVTLAHYGIDGPTVNSLKYTVIGCVIVFVVSLLEERGTDVRERILASNVIVRAAIYLFVLVLVSYVCNVLANSGGSGGFMYANF